MLQLLGVPHSRLIRRLVISKRLLCFTVFRNTSCSLAEALLTGLMLIQDYIYSLLYAPRCVTQRDGYLNETVRACPSENNSPRSSTMQICSRYMASQKTNIHTQ